MEGVVALKQVIGEYESLSRQLVNFEKSLAYFSKNVEENIRNQIIQVLRVRVANNPEKYLGLPTMVGCRKKNAFHLRKVHSKNKSMEY